jgi:pyridoxine 4-dehydrogenase
VTVTSETTARAPLGDRTVNRLGFGCMKLTGPRMMGPPADRDAALAVLRRAVELGVDHIDTSDHYGPHVANELIREALHPYPDDLVIVTKVGAHRTPGGGWVEALSPDELRSAVHEDLGRLGLDVLPVVNLRMPGLAEPVERSLAEPFGALVEMQQEGLIRDLSICHVTRQQIDEARGIAPVVAVQNHYNLIHREEDPLIDELAQEGIAYTALEGLSYTAFFPVSDLTAMQSEALEKVAQRVGASPIRVVLAWLLARSPNLLVIPGAASVDHLEDNMAAAELVLDPAELEELNRISRMRDPAF